MERVESQTEVIGEHANRSAIGKVRTGLQEMRDPQLSRTRFAAMTKPTGAACNLDCTYCFFLSKELLYDADSQRMSEATLSTYLTNFLDSQPDGPVEITWQGGEPTMRGLAFYRRAVELADQLKRSRQTVSHSIQTNGTLLDDEWGAFLAENHFLVGISIDGPAHLHDAYRINRAGRGSHAQVIRGWEVLQRHSVDTNILCTVHHANQEYPLEVYRYFRDQLGAKYLQFIPIVERVPGESLALAERGWRLDSGGKRTLLYRQAGDQVTSRSVRPEAYGDFLNTIFDEWFSRDVGEVFVQDFDVTIGNMFGRFSLCVRSPTCGKALAVEHNGDVYSCDHYVEPDHLLGNVASSSFLTLLGSSKQRDFGLSKHSTLPKQCVECPVLWACQGGCLKDRFITTPDGEPGLNYLCAGYLSFFTHSGPGFGRIASLIRAGRPASEVMFMEVHHG